MKKLNRTLHFSCPVVENVQRCAESVEEFQEMRVNSLLSHEREYTEISPTQLQVDRSAVHELGHHSLQC